jgi:hypothetical protein
MKSGLHEHGLKFAQRVNLRACSRGRADVQSLIVVVQLWWRCNRRRVVV